MKLKQLIRENVSDKKKIEEFIKKYCEIFDGGQFIIDSNGISISGSITITTPNGTIPYKFYEVSEDFDPPPKCKNLQNFPQNIGDTLTLPNTIETFKSEYPIHVRRLVIEFNDFFTDFNNFDIKATNVIHINSCENFKSLAGIEKLNFKGTLVIDDCGNFVEDLTKFSGFKILVSNFSPNLPVIKPILFTDSIRLGTIQQSNPEPIITISEKYQNKGIKSIFDFARELDDAGLDSHIIID